MKKNGFTLAEVIGVIVVLAVIALITFPIVTGYLNDSTNKLSEEQIKSLENVARIWATKNSDELTEDTPRYLTISELKRSGLIENEEILKMDSNDELQGCIKIYYENNKYNYKYDIYEDVTDCH